MKQPQFIAVTQFHLALSRQTRGLRRALFSGVVLYDIFSTVNRRFCHWFAFVFITAQTGTKEWNFLYLSIIAAGSNLIY